MACVQGKKKSTYRLNCSIYQTIHVYNVHLMNLEKVSSFGSVTIVVDFFYRSCPKNSEIRILLFALPNFKNINPGSSTY